MSLQDWVFLCVWMGLPTLILGTIGYCSWRGWRLPAQIFTAGLAGGLALQIWQGAPETPVAIHLHNTLLLTGVSLLCAALAVDALAARKRRERLVVGA